MVKKSTGRNANRGREVGEMSHSLRAEMGEEALEMIAARFRVLGEASRLKLIIALEGGEMNVSALVRRTGQTQANVSRQLQALSDAGILGRRKAGLNVFYRIADKSIFEMCDHVCGSLQRRINSQAGALLSRPAKRRSSLPLIKPIKPTNPTRPHR